MEIDGFLLKFPECSSDGISLSTVHIINDMCQAWIVGGIKMGRFRWRSRVCVGVWVGMTNIGLILFSDIIYFTTNKNGTYQLILSPRRSRHPRNSSLCSRITNLAPARKARLPKNVPLHLIQPSSSRRMPKSPNSKSEKANISTPSRLRSPTSFRPSRTDSARTSRRLRSRREELSARRARNDLATI